MEQSEPPRIGRTYLTFDQNVHLVAQKFIGSLLLCHQCRRIHSQPRNSWRLCLYSGTVFVLQQRHSSSKQEHVQSYLLGTLDLLGILRASCWWLVNKHTNKVYPSLDALPLKDWPHGALKNGTIYTHDVRQLNRCLRRDKRCYWSFHLAEKFLVGFTPNVPVELTDHRRQANKQNSVHHFASKLLFLCTTQELTVVEDVLGSPCVHYILWNYIQVQRKV